MQLLRGSARQAGRISALHATGLSVARAGD
jgi:hypothetical protein